MKKLMATVAAGALMITLAGCGNSSSSTKDNSSNDASSSKVVKVQKLLVRLQLLLLVKVRRQVKSQYLVLQ